MTVALIAHYLQWGLLAWLGLLALLVLGKMFAGTIPTRGFLSPRIGDDVTPQRAIAMGAFPLVLLFFVAEALNTLHTIDDLAPGMRPSLPDVPDYLVALLAGSNGLYLFSRR